MGSSISSEIDHVDADLKRDGYGINLTTQDLREVLSCDKSTVWRLIKRGEIRAVQRKKGGKILIPRRAVAEYLVGL